MLAPVAARTASYQAPLWLPGGHAQTVYASLLSPTLLRVDYKRERWDTPDGDFIDVDWLDPAADGPLVVCFHGLEGGSQGHYARSLMAKLRQQGWRGAVPHFRGCSGEPNRLPRAYFAGDSAEIDWILRRLRTQHPTLPIFTVGVSLGGNALLKWLGEQGDNALNVIDAAATISATMDLMITGDTLDAPGFNLFYRDRFLYTLKRKALQKLEQHPMPYDRQGIETITTLREFDNIVTAPLHGFKDTGDYWTRASSKPGLVHIRVPTLLINAGNDPFQPAFALPTAREVSDCVTLEFPETGGHVGFVSGPFPGKHIWLPERILEFFTTRLTSASFLAATHS